MEEKVAAKKNKKEEAPVMFGTKKEFVFRARPDDSKVVIRVADGVFHLIYKKHEVYFSNLKMYKYIFDGGEENDSFSVRFKIEEFGGGTTVSICLSKLTIKEKINLTGLKKALYDEIKSYES